MTVLFTAVIAAAYAFGVYLFPSLIPDMRRSLGFGYAEAGGITAARQAAFLATALASAAAVRRFGAGLVIFGSMLLCGLALCGVGAAPDTWVAAVLLVVLNACVSNDIRNPSTGDTENPSTSATVTPRPMPVRVPP